MTYVVVITASNDTLQLYPGMTATVDIKVTEHRDVLRVPSAALRFRPTPATAPPARTAATGLPPRHSGQGEVYVLGTRGTFTTVPVTIGIADAAFTEIVGGNLSEGQHVAVGRRPGNGAGT